MYEKKLGLLDFQKNMMNANKNLTTGTIKECLKETGILYVKGGHKGKIEYFSSRRQEDIKSWSSLDNGAISLIGNCDKEESVFEMCTCFICKSDTIYKSNNAAQVVMIKKDRMIQKSSSCDGNWRQVGFRTYIDKHRLNFETQDFSINSNNSDIDKNDLNIDTKPYKPFNEICTEKSIASEKEFLPSAIQQYPWVKLVNQLSNTHKVQYEDRNINLVSNLDDEGLNNRPGTANKCVQGNAGIGCLSPVKAKNPNDLTRILNAGIDRGNRKGSWHTFNNAGIYNENHSTPLMMKSNIKGNPLSFCQDINQENYKNNYENLLIQSSIKPENQIFSMGLRPAIPRNINDYKHGIYTEKLDFNNNSEFQTQPPQNTSTENSIQYNPERSSMGYFK